MDVRTADMVSIPFIAGQWSLPKGGNEHGEHGSGFNPLHCGAVVASGQGRVRAHDDLLAFQSPSLRGSGRFGRGSAAMRERTLVSIPFIAGQWSLPFQPLRLHHDLHSVSIPFIAGQWSLHRGLVLAEVLRALFQSPSLRGSGRFPAARVGAGPGPRFNPLHCGAVVASRGDGGR